MSPSSEVRMRQTSIFGSNDLSPLSPRAFFDQLFPFLARVYVEVSDENKELGMVLQDKRVWNAVISILGFDPAHDRYQYAPELFVQSWVLQRGREAETALYVADEIKQYDGQVALDYAAGWIRALDFMEGIFVTPEPTAQGQKPIPPDEFVLQAAHRELDIFKAGNADEFIEGYRDCVASKLDKKNTLLQSVVREI